MLRFLFVLAGTVSLAVGIVGIFVPGLPTTPFLLLTATLYLKSSDKLYSRLMKHPRIGKYISNYQANGGLLLSQKLYSIGFMWGMIVVSSVFFIESRTIKICLFVAGIVGTVMMGFCLRTGKKHSF